MLKFNEPQRIEYIALANRLLNILEGAMTKATNMDVETQIYLLINEVKFEIHKLKTVEEDKTFYQYAADYGSVQNRVLVYMTSLSKK